MSASIAEVHSLIMTQFILDNSWFASFNDRQLVGIFSCFTDIKIPEEKRRCVPPDVLREPLKGLKRLYEDYDDMETTEDIRTGINYYNAIQYDMVELAMQWCDCESEIECKQFIYSELSNKEISVGDFNKAMMKIATVARELAKIAEEMGHIELLHKLSKVDGLIFKYVTTAQSLYL
jgi:superfamily II RNA helicase